MLDASGIAV